MIENRYNVCSLYKESVTEHSDQSKSICFEVVKSLPYSNEADRARKELYMERRILRNKPEHLDLICNWT